MFVFTFHNSTVEIKTQPSRCSWQCGKKKKFRDHQVEKQDHVLKIVFCFVLFFLIWSETFNIQTLLRTITHHTENTWTQTELKDEMYEMCFAKRKSSRRLPVAVTVKKNGMRVCVNVRCPPRHTGFALACHGQWPTSHISHKPPHHQNYFYRHLYHSAVQMTHLFK